MASLQRRSKGGYRIVFRFAGQKYSRSLGTMTKRVADAALARLEANLHRIEIGTLKLPDDADIASVLLSGGNVTAKRKAAPKPRSLEGFLTGYLSRIPKDAMEDGTRNMMAIHARHLFLIRGANIRIQSIDFTKLQLYVQKRASEKGRRGKKISAVTIKNQCRDDQEGNQDVICSVEMGLEDERDIAPSSKG